MKVRKLIKHNLTQNNLKSNYNWFESTGIIDELPLEAKYYIAMNAHIGQLKLFPLF